MFDIGSWMFDFGRGLLWMVGCGGRGKSYGDFDRSLNLGRGRF